MCFKKQIRYMMFVYLCLKTQICFSKNKFKFYNPYISMHLFFKTQICVLKHKFVSSAYNRFVFQNTNALTWWFSDWCAFVFCKANLCFVKNTNLLFHQKTNLTLFHSNLSFVILICVFVICVSKHKFAISQKTNYRNQNTNIPQKG